MAYSRSVIVKRAQSWIGCKESDGSHKKIIDIYNSQKPLPVGYKMSYSDAWCAAFVSAVALKCGYTKIIPTECGCGRYIDLFKKMGCWVESDSYVPKAGDIIFYDWSDNGVGENIDGADHVGIVEKVSGSTITVIEGNYSNAVKRRNLSINGRYIRGYGVPKYDNDGTAVSNSSAISNKKELLEVDGLWGVATTTRAQRVFGTTVDGIVSNQDVAFAKSNPGLLATSFEWEKNPSGGSQLIKAIQKKVGMCKSQQDGIIGPLTIKAMQKFFGTVVDGFISSPSDMVKAMQKWLNKQKVV